MTFISLKLAAVLAFAALTMAACGGSTASSPVASSAAAPASSPAASAAAKPSVGASAGASAKPAASSAAQASGARPSLKIAYGTNSSATFSPLWLADAAHAFEHHGVDVKLNYILSAQSTPALLAKGWTSWRSPPTPSSRQT